MFPTRLGFYENWLNAEYFAITRSARAPLRSPQFSPPRRRLLQNDHDARGYARPVDLESMPDRAQIIKVRRCNCAPFAAAPRARRLVRGSYRGSRVAPRCGGAPPGSTSAIRQLRARRQAPLCGFYAAASRSCWRVPAPPRGDHPLPRHRRALVRAGLALRISHRRRTWRSRPHEAQARGGARRGHPAGLHAACGRQDSHGRLRGGDLRALRPRERHGRTDLLAERGVRRAPH